jgi:hypothetical protein
MTYCVNAQGQAAACQAPLSAYQIYGLAKAAGFPQLDAMYVTAIALAESAGIPNATNGQGYYGLLQINTTLHGVTVAQATNPAQAFTVGHTLYQNRINTQGQAARFNDWQTWTTGAYKAFLRQAEVAALTADSGAGNAVNIPAPTNPFSGAPNPITGVTGAAGDVTSAISGIPGDIAGALAPLLSRALLVTIGLVGVVLGVVLMRGPSTVTVPADAESGTSSDSAVGEAAEGAA